MDVTASLRELLLDQTFTKSPVYQLVFPIGFQDAVLYLIESVGGDIGAAEAKEQRTLTARTLIPAPAPGPPAREERPFSLCGLSRRTLDRRTTAGAP